MAFSRGTYNYLSDSDVHSLVTNVVSSIWLILIYPSGQVGDSN